MQHIHALVLNQIADVQYHLIVLNIVQWYAHQERSADFILPRPTQHIGRAFRDHPLQVVVMGNIVTDGDNICLDRARRRNAQLGRIVRIGYHGGFTALGQAKATMSVPRNFQNKPRKSDCSLDNDYSLR